MDRLGKGPWVYRLASPPSLQDASGASVNANGGISLEFKRQHGNRIHECEFYVFPPSSDHLDIVIGVQYIVKEGLLSVNQDALLPLVEHQVVTGGKFIVHRHH